jgi:CheY-like chemotaxis protein
LLLGGLFTGDFCFQLCNIDRERAIVGIFDKIRSTFGNADLEAGVDAEEGAQIKGERRRKKRVNARDDTRALIVDDSPTVVFALKKILRSAGFITLEALDAESGLELARTEKPDLIFLDIILPGVNGFAALRNLRRDPLTRHIPVIMISGNEQATELFFGSRIGADDFMKKPFSRFEVFARIERLLDADMVPRRISISPDEAESGLPE